MNENYLKSLQATGNDQYFEAAESSAEWCFEAYMKPHFPNLNDKCVLEIACGHGRNANQLLKHFQPSMIFLVDINHDNIEFVRKRFEGRSVTAMKCDGISLPVNDNCIDFIYSFDSMVHFNFTLMKKYVAEIKRTLNVGGSAFLHFSNAGEGDLSSEKLSKFGLRGMMTNDAMLSIIEGFEIVNNELIDWGEKNLDAIIVLKRK